MLSTPLTRTDWLQLPLVPRVHLEILSRLVRPLRKPLYQAVLVGNERCANLVGLLTVTVNAGVIDPARINHTGTSWLRLRTAATAQSDANN
jgi:hypothetical protein